MTRSGFTLLELLVAMVIVATLVAALATFVSGAFRARARVNEVLDAALARSLAIHTVECDLIHAAVPDGTLAGPMLGETEEGSGGFRSDRLEIYTASGRLVADTPWGDMVKVEYYLAVPSGAPPASAVALIRATTRNLLPSAEDTPEEEVVARDVEGLTIQYFDGESWVDSWDSTAQDNAPPEAISLRVDYLPAEDGTQAHAPLKVLCEISVQPASTGVEGGVTS